MPRPATRKIPDAELPHAVLSLERGTVTVAEGPDAGRSTPIEAGGSVAVGSDPANDLLLADETVSGRHLVIAHRVGGFVVRDQGSTNGTWVDGVRVTEAMLPRGARILAGKSLLTVAAESRAVALFSSEKEEFQLLCGKSRKMRELFGLLERLAPSTTTILLTGETGTGKELAARSIHLASSRAGRPFVVFDCGRAARELVESELFGHEKGAFTGAAAQRAGVFEQADGGTLFIDEIGELPLELQPKLLRLLEERIVRPLGGSRALPVDVRIVAATHRDLEAMVEAGTFREDLFYRVAVVHAELPPLRERPEDLMLLARRILERQRDPAGLLTPEAVAVLTNQSWHGNVREMANVLERASALAGGEAIQPSHLMLSGRRPRMGSSNDASTLAGRTLSELEREAIVQTLAASDNNKSLTAKRLGIASSTLFEKMRRLGIR